MSSDALKGHAAMLLFAALISGSYSLGHRVAPFIEPDALTAIRFTVAAAVLAAATAATGRFRPAALSAPWRYAVLGGLFSIYFVLMFEALRLSDPVPLAAVFTLTPLLSTAFAWPLIGQRPGGRMLFSLSLACAGALWVIFRADLNRLMAFDVNAGERIFFFGCAAHALYTVMVRRLNRGEPVVVFTLGTTVAGAAILLAFSARELAVMDWMALPAMVWWVIAYLAVFTTAGTFFIVQFAVMHLPAGKVMAYGYLVPSFTILWEGFTGRGWVAWPVVPGIVLTVIAMLVLATARTHQSQVTGRDRRDPAE